MISHTEPRPSADGISVEPSFLVQALSLDDDSTIDSAETALDSVQNAWDDVKADAEVVDETKAQEAEDALDALEDALGSLSGDATLTEAATAVLTALQGFGLAILSIEDTITCE